MKKYQKVAIVFLFGFLGGLTGSLVVSLFQASSSPITETSSSSEKVTVSNENYDNETSVTEAVSTVQDAVVSVIGYEQNSGTIDSLFGSQNSSGDLTVSSEGSGVIYKKRGRLCLPCDQYARDCRGSADRYSAIVWGKSRRGIGRFGHLFRYCGHQN